MFHHLALMVEQYWSTITVTLTGYISAGLLDSTILYQDFFLLTGLKAWEKMFIRTRHSLSFIKNKNKKSPSI